MRLGVCYYPEQWPQEWWTEDAHQMVELGIGQVRIGEFCWSRIEPSPGVCAYVCVGGAGPRYQCSRFGWLEDCDVHTHGDTTQVADRHRSGNACRWP